MRASHARIALMLPGAFDNGRDWSLTGGYPEFRNRPSYQFGCFFQWSVIFPGKIPKA